MNIIKFPFFFNYFLKGKVFFFFFLLIFTFAYYVVVLYSYKDLIMVLLFSIPPHYYLSRTSRASSKGKLNWVYNKNISDTSGANAP